MKNVLIATFTTLALALPLATPTFAGVTSFTPVTLQFPTDFDGYMADKGKKTVQKPSASTSE